MSDRDVSLFVVDLLVAADKIRRYLEPVSDVQDFVRSELEFDAVIRELQVVGEAVNALLSAGFLDSSYRRIVDFRNQIVHAYFGIDSAIIWEVVNVKLPLLVADILKLVQSGIVDISTALSAAIADNKHAAKTVAFLEDLGARLK